MSCALQSSDLDETKGVEELLSLRAGERWPRLGSVTKGERRKEDQMFWILHLKKSWKGKQVVVLKVQ